MTNTEPRIDAVSLGIMWDRLVSLTDEILTSLVRSSFSSIARESYDLSVVVLDAECNAIAQGSYSVPSFTGTAAPTLRHMLRKFPPETLRPGDVIATNDSWMGTGHLFDISVMRPVFRGDRLVGYTLSISHLPDIGGVGFSTEATEIFHEGLRLPICKLAREGEVDRFILDLFRANSRVPDQTVGDVMANITCNEVGGRQLLEFMDDYGIDDLGPLSRAIRGHAEAAMREKIRAWRDGTYTYEADHEGVDEPIRIAASVTVEGDGVAIDFAGTSGCVNRRHQRALRSTPARWPTTPASASRSRPSRSMKAHRRRRHVGAGASGEPALLRDGALPPGVPRRPRCRRLSRPYSRRSPKKPRASSAAPASPTATFASRASSTCVTRARATRSKCLCPLVKVLSRASPESRTSSSASTRRSSPPASSRKPSRS